MPAWARGFIVSTWCRPTAQCWKAGISIDCTDRSTALKLPTRQGLSDCLSCSGLWFVSSSLTHLPLLLIPDFPQPAVCMSCTCAHMTCWVAAVAHTALKGAHVLCILSSPATCSRRTGGPVHATILLFMLFQLFKAPTICRPCLLAIFS